MMTEPIKPCPYCGYEQADKLTESGKEYFVYCQCGARGSTARCGDDAVLLWNAAANALTVERKELEAAQAERDEWKNRASWSSSTNRVLTKIVDELTAERDEARSIARKLWREKQAETHTLTRVCPACNGERYVITEIIGYSTARMQICFVCNGTGKVTRCQPSHPRSHSHD